jgi:LuxR family transcriptional regulator
LDSSIQFLRQTEGGSHALRAQQIEQVFPSQQNCPLGQAKDRRRDRPFAPRAGALLYEKLNMHLLDEVFDRLPHMHTAEEAFEVIKRAAAELGFPYCAYGQRTALPLSRPEVRIVSNYPAEWQALYLERGYAARDPSVRRAASGKHSVIWNAQEDNDDAQFWNEAASFGLKHGWAQASRDCFFNLGMLSLVRDTEAITLAEVRSQRMACTALAQAAHLHLMPLLASAPAAASTADKLTSREREVLTWTADGKTAFEIGQILGTAERTVKFHLQNAVVKLGAMNKTHAAMKAVVLGLLA